MTFSCYKKKPATTVLPPGLKPVLMLTNPSPDLRMKEPEEHVPFFRKRPSESSGAKTIREIDSSSKNNVMSAATPSTKRATASQEIRPKDASPLSTIKEVPSAESQKSGKPVKNFRSVSIIDDKTLNTFGSDIAEAEPTLYVECLHYNFDWNGAEHNTHFYHFYSKENLVVRRGQPFKISVKFNQTMQEDDCLSILFQLDSAQIPEFSNGTLCLAKIISQVEKPSYNWIAFHSEIPQDSNDLLDVDIIPPLNCIVGKWKLSIYNKGSNIYTSDVSLCVIFNPLLEYGEQMPLERPHLHEYLFKEVGDFVLGTPDKPRLEFWKFSQFHKDVLSIAYSLLYEKSQLDYINGGDIVLVSQALIKSTLKTVYDYHWGQISDPRGIFGSKSLLEEYTKTKLMDTKKYFLAEIGILITLFRALGIPARAVTGFGIVRHIKNDKSFTCNRYYTKDSLTVNDLNQELWYFRPWVEIFLPRNDIGENFSDWQYVFECGPVSRYAIRKKHLEKPYGTFDAFNTMNNGILLWDYDETKNTKFTKLINYDNKILKRKIFTKGTNSRTVTDITESYDLEKESIPHIYAVLKKRKHVGDYVANSKCNDLEIDFQFEEEVLIGADIKFIMILKNKSDIHNINANYVLIFESIFPDGKTHNNIHKSEDKCLVKKNMMDSREIVFKAEHYVEKLEAEYGLCRVCLQVRVKAFNYSYIVDKYISIKPPLLTMTLFMKDITEEEINYVQIQLTNSINKDINDSQLILQEVDTNNKVVLKIKKIAALGKLVVNIQLDNMDKDGSYYFVAKFLSDSIKCKVFGKMEQKKEEHQFEPMNK